MFESAASLCLEVWALREFDQVKLRLCRQKKFYRFGTKKEGNIHMTVWMFPSYNILYKFREKLSHLVYSLA